MEPVPGFVSVPRAVGLSRPPGAFFSAPVLGAAGPGLWKVTLDGKPTIVASDLPLVPGQMLRLKLVSHRPDRWVFQVLADPRAVQEPPQGPPALVNAFLAQGLPVLGERLEVWSRWLGAAPRPVDKEAWAASMEARDIGPSSKLADALAPWLGWQADLEAGRSGSPPDDADFWDLWNLRKPSGDPWLVMPLRWVYQGVEEAGLLQAHWDPPRQAIDRWTLTAAPAGVPFRLEARCSSGRLHLVWRFFRGEDQRHWADWLKRAGNPFLSQDDLAVTLEVTGAPPLGSVPLQKGVDVEA